MGDKSAISWTDASWNPVTGCSHVSPGCDHCYAETLSLRHKWSAKPWTVENAAENVVLHPDRLVLPLRWQKPRRIFVNSMSDLFHEQVPDEFIDKVFAVMALASRHTFQVLTKRAKRMREYVRGLDTRSVKCAALDVLLPGKRDTGINNITSLLSPEHQATLKALATPVPSSVWLGVTVESAEYLWRLNHLVETPAAVRIVSFEPLIGDVGDLSKWLYASKAICRQADLFGADAEQAELVRRATTKALNAQPIKWAIIGGESGPGYRPMDLDWARSIKRQCDDAGVKVWFKQAGGPRPGMGEDALGRVYQQFPEVAA